jgi:hypothetical protein
MDRQDPHFRAVVTAKWFAAAFALFCVGFAALAHANLLGQCQQDAPVLVRMALAGSGMFVLAWFAIWFVTRKVR